jgi:hypothetical protein
MRSSPGSVAVLSCAHPLVVSLSCHATRDRSLASEGRRLDICTRPSRDSAVRRLRSSPSLRRRSTNNRLHTVRLSVRRTLQRQPMIVDRSYSRIAGLSQAQRISIFGQSSKGAHSAIRKTGFRWACISSATTMHESARARFLYHAAGKGESSQWIDARGSW